MQSDDELLADVRARGRALRRRARRQLAGGLSAAALVAVVGVGAVLTGDDQRSEQVTAEADGTDPGAPGTAVAVEGPIEVRVTMVPMNPVVGEVVTFTVTTTLAEPGYVKGIAVPDFGDGSMSGGMTAEGYSCPAMTEPSTQTQTFSHGYAQAGSYRFSAMTPAYDPCRTAEEFDPDGVSASIEFEVGPNENPPTNGPDAPAIILVPRPDETGPTHQVLIGGGDPDGFVRRLELDWGDGTIPEVLEFPLDGCVVHANGWPSGSVPGPDNVREHTYGAPGSYTITLTMTTVGCDGGSEQVGSLTASAFVG